MTDTEKGALFVANIIVYVYRASYKYNRVFITSDHSVIGKSIILTFPIFLEENVISLYNAHVQNQGSFMFSEFQLSIDFENVIFDLYMARGGTWVNLNWFLPFSNPRNLVRFETVKFYFSQGNESDKIINCFRKTNWVNIQCSSICTIL